MKPKQLKSSTLRTRRSTKIVSEFEALVQLFQQEFSDEFAQFKKRHPKTSKKAFEEFILRKLAGLTALTIRTANRRVKSVA